MPCFLEKMKGHIFPLIIESGFISRGFVFSLITRAPRENPDKIVWLGRIGISNSLNAYKKLVK